MTFSELEEAFVGLVARLYGEPAVRRRFRSFEARLNHLADPHLVVAEDREP